MKYITVELCFCWYCKDLLILDHAWNEQYENVFVVLSSACVRQLQIHELPKLVQCHSAH